MIIGVIGANGQLGTDVCAAFNKNGDQVIELNHDKVEITDIDVVSSVLKSLKPDIVVNTAAYHHVEKCETEHEKAFSVNALGARNLAMLSRDLGFFIIHISTDYVFDGNKEEPYLEEDLPSPLNVYANTKLSGELFVQAIAEKFLIMRSSGLYGKSPCRAKGYNFVDIMLKLAKERDEVRVVDNEVLTPTSTAELAKQMVKVSRDECYGLSHATAEGSCSWYDFAKEIFRIKKINTPLNIAGPDEFPIKVARPSYSVLENGFLKKHALNVFGNWEEGLEDYLKDN